jgi:serine/threonine protein kinase
MKNFKNAINKLIRMRAADCAIHSLEVDRNWTLIFCPKTKHYFAMNRANASCIQSTLSCIRPAYRIDPNTGKPHSTTMDKSGEPRKFAMKIFSGNKNANIAMAKNEIEALDENQSTDWSFTNEGQPIIVMDYHAGETICNTNGEPNYSLLSRLSLKDRLALIFQIANQFYEIHAQKILKKPRVHVDVKGSNILIDVPKGGPVNARVIDFGSSKVLDESGNVDTGLNGVTPMTIPLEAVSISNTKMNRFATLEDTTGFLNRESDIYELGAVFMAMLGAADPYANRRGQISYDNFYDLELLNTQVRQGFNFTDLLQDSITKLPFEMHTSSQLCAFRNHLQIEAPNNQTILADETLPALGYILYKDQLLYVDKEKQKVFGRDITSKLIAFKQKAAQIKDLQNTEALTPTDLARCIEINSFHSHDKKPIDDILRPLIRHFLNQMVELDHTKRPSTEEVLRFFTIANKLASMATVKDTTRTNAEIELRIQIALLQLHIITYKGWHIELPLLLPDNTRSNEETGSFSQFDFDSLEQNTQLFNQFCQVFSDSEILNGKKPLTTDTFHFLQIQSEKKKLFDAILTKLQIQSESGREAKHLYEKVMDLLSKDSKEPDVHVKKRGINKEKLLENKLSESSASNVDQGIASEGVPTALPVANKFLSLSRSMMTCLLEEELPPDFANDFNLKKEFFKHRQFIEADFPKFVAMEQTITAEGLNSIRTLLEEAPDITLFLSCDLNDASQVADLLKHQCQVEQNIPPLTPQSETKLFALYKEMLSYKEHILNATSESTLAKLTEILTKPLLKNLQDYIANLETLQKKGVIYQKYSFFGMFGHTVAKKHEVATMLLKAFKLGDQSFLENLMRDKTLNSALTSKTLGGISQPYLSCMKINTKSTHTMNI